MNYDVQIGNTIRRGISFAKLITFPIGPETFVRRANGEWIYAKDCIELTHILMCRNDIYSNDIPVNQNHQANYLQNNYSDVEDFDTGRYTGDDVENDDDVQFELYAPPSQITVPSVGPAPDYNDDVEERIFIPTAEYFKCKQKRKAALIGVCTLGLAGLSLMGVGNTWRSNIFAETSLSANAGISFVLKCLSFCLLTVLIALPYFIYSVIALIYYSIRVNNLKR